MKFLAIMLLGIVLPAQAQHPAHARMSPMMQAPVPATSSLSTGNANPPAEVVPTAAERELAFPDLGSMDMRDHMQDNPLIAVLRVDEWERHTEGALTAEVRASIGGNFDKFLLRGEVEKYRGQSVQGDAELLWTHATGPWWDRVIGVRRDFGKWRSRDWLAIGVSGLAPYELHIEATAYASESGRLAARLEGEYEWRLGRQLILQPRLETNFYGGDDIDNGIAAGLSDAELGLRLRYEFNPQFAPYVGYAWARKFGGTADYSEAVGEPVHQRGWVLGLRFWF